ncbi:MAG: DMT family transporter [candidate division WOR-3 bacterium]|nr:MAG: DMT family transporter [candidate division WOR-3 bacterium]
MDRSHTRKLLGVIAVLSASIMWALEPIFAKIAYRSAGVASTFAVRTVFSLLVITLYILFTNRRHFSVKRKYLPTLVILSLTATLFADLIYIYALTMVPVINAVLIGHMQPVFVVIIGYFTLRHDRITKYDYLGIAAMIIAGILVTTGSWENLAALRMGTIGDLYVLMATVAWAATAIIARKYLRVLPAGTIAFYRFFIAGILFISYVAAAHGLQVPNIHQILLGVVIGIGTVLYYQGIKMIKAAQTSALELSTPFFAAFLGYMVLQEYISTFQFIGMVFLLPGIYFLAKKEPPAL